MVIFYAHGGRISLPVLSRLDGRYTEHHLGYLKYTYSCELNCDMIFLGKRIKNKIKIGKKMKIATGYFLFCLYHRDKSECSVSRMFTCVYMFNTRWIPLLTCKRARLQATKRGTQTRDFYTFREPTHQLPIK